MRSRVMLLLGFAVAALMLTGCSSAPNSTTGSKPEASPPTGAPDTQSPAAGTRLAPGLYELADGSAQAVGVLEYRNLEGGTWVIVGGTEAEGNVGEVVAVVANPTEFEAPLKELKGQLVVASGTKLDGASIRMAGPEIEIKSIEAIKDSGGAAQ
jgi:hypothetical protein